MTRVQPQPGGEKIMLEQLVSFQLQAANHPINVVQFLKCIAAAPRPANTNEMEGALWVLTEPTTSAKKELASLPKGASGPIPSPETRTEFSCPVSHSPA